MEISKLTELHRSWTTLWHTVKPVAVHSDLTGLVEQNHLENFSLWHQEDIARRDDLGPDSVCRAKRKIDSHNQRRNDLIEQIDKHLVERFNPPTGGCPFNSETPGMMIDRLSILALKRYHMQEEVDRIDAALAHREKCGKKVVVIVQQIADLSVAFTELLEQVQRGNRSFRVYFQFKMYNDKELNPQLRKAA